MTEERVEPAPAEEPRRPRYLAEVEDEDARARARGNLLMLLTGGLLGGG